MWRRLLALFGVALVCLGAKPGGGGGPPADPAIAYVENGDLKVMNADGSNKAVIVAGAGINAQPAWSPDGARVAFQQSAGGLYVVDRDGSNLTLLSAGTAGYPAWSSAPAPDGREKIAFNRVVTNPDGTTSNEIWLVNTDGTGLQNLTGTPDRTEIYPTWSPDAGRLAVFYQDLATVDGQRVVTGRGLAVFHLAAGSSAPLEIVQADVVVSGGPTAPVLADLDWARGGDRIAYASGGDLYVLDLAAPESPTQLTATSGLAEWSPSWSPDDSTIVFWRSGSGGYAKQSGLFTMNASGSGVTSLGARSGTLPDWRR